MKLSQRLCLALLAAVGAASSAFAQQGVALTSGNGLVTLTVPASPSPTPVTTITGLATGETVIAVDYRPINRTLVGLTDQNRLFVIDAGTGAATLLSTLSLPLTGTLVATDFNPVPDRLRIVTNTGLNYRVNVDTGGVTVDGAIAYAAGDAGASVAGPVQLAGAAYTNAVAGRLATATTLYTIDVGRGVLCTQNPPNNGTQVTIGSLGVTATAVKGFDIFAPNVGYAVLVVGGSASYYSINLTTGAATRVNTIPSATIDIALQPKEPALGIVNTSSRGLVAPGEGAVIQGFVIGGTAPVNVLITTRGPSLTAFGVTSALADTSVAVYRGGTLLDSNDDWQAHARATEITASGLAPLNTKESAVLISLVPGTYSAIVTGVGTATSGVAMVDIFELP